MTRSSHRVFWLLWILSAAVLPAAEGTLHYPDVRSVDLVDLRLSVVLTPESLLARTLEGRAELTLRPRSETVESLVLDAVDLTILEVEMLGERGALAYSYDDIRLSVALPRAVRPGETFRIAVRYRVEDPPKGLYFILPSAAAPERPTVVYSQAEAFETRYWVPILDRPDARLTSEIAVSVPSRYSAVAVGELRETRRSEDRESVTYVWRNDIPTTPFHLGFVAGELVELPQDRRGGDQTGKPVRIYTQPGFEDAARATFRRVPRMLDFFTELLGVDFPYPGYAHITVPGHHHGGMEHAGYSLLDSRFLTEGPAGEMPVDPFESSLIAHMLAHQWFGGIVSYRSVTRAWLNEGFASYLHLLFAGRDSPRDFEQAMWSLARNIARFDRSETGRPMVDPKHEDADAVFRYDGLKIYWKGAWVLHMLRRQLGDEVFFRGVRSYLEKPRERSVESADLRYALEDVSGRSLERFFDQWVDGWGVPRLRVTYAWEPASREARVLVEQTQKIDGATPAFVFPLDLYFRIGDREARRSVEIREARHELTFGFEAAPDLFVVDPDHRLLKTLETQKPRALRIAQVEDAPSVTARLEAVRSLEKDPSPEAVRALARALGSEERFWAVREAAAESLGRMQRQDALTALLAAAPGRSSKVRAAVLSALGQYRFSRQAHEALLKPLPEGTEVAVEGTVVAALGRLRGTPELIGRSVERLRVAASQKSRRWVRRQALGAIGELGDPRLFDTVMTVAQSEAEEVLREQAIRTLGALGGKEALREKTRAALIRWLDDPDRGVQAAAVEALGALGDPEARGDLARIAASARHEALRDAARSAIESLERPADPSRSAPALLERVEKLERKNRELEEKLEELRRQLEDSQTL